MLLVVVNACTADTTPSTSIIELPPPNQGFDYQLGEAYEPADDVRIVARDRTAEPHDGSYNICYVNGFQTQPGEEAFWVDEHADLILRDRNGEFVIDPEWPNEYILDIATSEKRARLTVIVSEWIRGCAAAGFQAVEFDNLDTYSRFPADLEANDAVAFAQGLVGVAHAAGLAAGQKNSADLVSRSAETGFDFAVVEQCSEYRECDQFIEGFGDLVFMIEYKDDAFRVACDEYPQLSIVMRDLGLTPPSSSTYVRESC